MRHRRHINRSSTVFRSVRDRAAFGVCGGLAEHFQISSLWLRLGFVAGTIFSGGIAPLLYFICIFIMPREDLVRDCVPPLPEDARGRRFQRRTQQRPTFESREEAASALHSQFDSIEEKIRRMEDYVTSKEYVLKRKFENL